MMDSQASKRQKLGASNMAASSFRISSSGCIAKICTPFKQCQCIEFNGDSIDDEQNRNLIMISDVAFESLPEPEKDRVYNDLYGTADAIPETEIFIDEKLQQLDEAMDAIPFEKKASYLLALDEEESQSTKYVRSVKFRLMFLRADRFNAAKAAMRLCHFFTEKKEMFGLAKLPRRIVQADLDDDDREALLSGALFIRSGMDHCNRMAFFIRRQQFQFKNFINLKRAWFYYIQSSIEDNAEAQKLGIMYILYNVGSCDHHEVDLRKHVKTLRKFLVEAMPYRRACLHHCFNDLKDNLLMSWYLMATASLMRARYNSYFGSHKNCRKEMIKYGIRLDLFPVDQNGEYDKDMLIRVLKKLSKKEDQPDSSTSEGSSSESKLTLVEDYDDDSSLGSY